jgi:hypothetical protein
MRIARPAHPHRRAAVLGGALLTLLAGCSPAQSGGAAPPSASGPTALPLEHVHGLGIDPGDGALLLATHTGLIEVGDDGALSQPGPVIDLMGFSVAGVDHYLASGHPGLRVDLPQPVGLIESTDGGQTWTPLSRAGESDFHALTAADAGVLGFDGALRRSADGRTWEELTIPAEPHTLAAAPDGKQVLATTQAGLLHSTDAGTSWFQADAPLLQVVAWADATTAVGVDPDGAVWISTDAAGSWQRRAELGAAPLAVAAAPATRGGPGRIAVVTDESLLESTDGGRTFTVALRH